jgi:ribonuclease HI
MWKQERYAKQVLARERKVCSFHGTARETQEYRKLLAEEIQEGVMVPVAEKYVEYWNSTFLVPKRDGSFRKVLNCKRINKLMQCSHFKMEDCRTVTEQLMQGDYATSIDIRSAYNHVNVHPALRPYLGFSFEGRSYVYKAMPFGLKNAPRVFTKIMRVMMWEIRRRWKIRSVCYLDDLLFLHQDPQELNRITSEIVQWMDELGWTIHQEKSALVPLQVFPFLGWEWNSQLMTVRLTTDKRMGLRSLVNAWILKMKKRKWVPVREVAALIGSLNATRLQFPEASLHLVKLNRWKCSMVAQAGWEARGSTTYMISGDLQWWGRTLKTNEPKSLAQEGKPQAHIWVDASPSGWGAWLHRPEGRVVAFGKWPDSITAQTNNFRELWAVIMGIKRFAPLLTLSQVQHIRLHSDNTAVVVNVRRKAAARNLYPALRHLLNLCKRLDLRISVEHIPGVSNTTADALSRLSRSGDYALMPDVYQQMCSQMGFIPTVDLFATSRNGKVPTFISPLRRDATMVTDALSIPWGTGLPFLHPPIPLIARCLRKILQENVPALMVLPHWKGQSWSVLLQKMSRQEIVLGKAEAILVPGRQMVQKGDKLPPGHMVAHLLTPPYCI